MKNVYRTISILCFLVMGIVGLSAQQASDMIADLSVRADQLQKVKLPYLDNEQLKKNELEQRRKGRPPHFAEAVEVQITPQTHGRWDQWQDRSVWRLRLQSPGAHSLNLGFGRYQMPRDGRLLIYNLAQDRVMGPFTPADNEEHAQLWTPVFAGEEIVIEVQVPTRRREQLDIQLDFVNHDFMDFQQLASGSCNLDIVCDDDDGWEEIDAFRDASRSVGVFSLGGRLLCTGFLVNNVRNDCTPYFMTANHCDVRSSNAASLVVYWNYQNSVCRQPDSQESGQAGDGKLDDFNTGAQMLARWSTTDFTLVKLDDPVSETAEAYFAGWSAEDVLPEGRVATIHHPFTEEKRISLANTPLHTSFWGSSQPIPNGSHLIVPQWAVGTTQSGSSGAPLFNEQGQVIGQLQGGDAACGNEEYDSFGRFHTSWEGGGTSASRLRDWLDPDGTGLLSIDGRDQEGCQFVIQALLAEKKSCAGQADTALLIPSAGFADSIRFTLSSDHPEISLELLPAAIAPEDTAYLRISTTADLAPGLYSITGTGTDGVQQSDFELLLVITQMVTAVPEIVAPRNEAIDQSLQPFLVWTALPAADEYEVIISYNDGNGMIISDVATTSDTLLWLPDLSPTTTYTWQVRAGNRCGFGSWSDPVGFTTADWSCQQVVSDHPPMAISDEKAETISSSLSVSGNGLIASVEVLNLDIQHAWVGDLKISLRAPSGKEVVLMDRPGYPASLYGCDGANLLLNFNQNSRETYQVLENTCQEDPALSGTFQPLQSLQGLRGEPAAGEWTLIVNDQAAEDGGELVSWQLSICTQAEAAPLLSPLGSEHEICAGDTLRFGLVISEEFSGSEVTLSPSDIPENSLMTFSKNPAVAGDTVQVTLSQLADPGQYSVAVAATDGLLSATTQVQLTVGALPTAPPLLLPADEGKVETPTPQFVWSGSANATLYRLEIAKEATLAQPIVNGLISDTLFTLVDELDASGTFYWRVTAINDCGETVSPVFQFSYQTTATTLLEDGQLLQVFPNPFATYLSINMKQPLAAPLELRLLDVTGRALQREQLAPGRRQTRWELGDIPAGVYILELTYRGRRYSQKLIRG